MESGGKADYEDEMDNVCLAHFLIIIIPLKKELFLSK